MHPWTAALLGWFAARAAGRLPPFPRVLAILKPPEQAILHDLLDQDRHLAARFRAVKIP